MPPIDRRQFIKTAALLGASAAAGLSAPLAAAPARKPSILFIMADDLGYADLSIYGRREYQTPVLDQLARDGLMMTHAYASSSVCSPTRTALITGRYQYRLRVGLEEPLGGPGFGLPPEHPTIASQLRQAGYHTSLVGKWHLGGAPDYGPLKSGYDRFFGFYPGGIDYFAHKALHGKVKPWGDELPGDGLHDQDQPVEVDGYLTDVFGDRAIADIRDFAATDKPFFLSLHFSAPHWPWEGPNDIRRSRDLTTILDTDGGSLEIYAEMVKSLDANVGRVLAELDRLGLAEDTIVVFTSDNGGERFSDMWPFTGAKTELLEGGIRVPGIVRWPRAIKPGRTSEQVIASMDWMPTLLAAAGGEPHPDYPLDGENLLDVITGQAAARERTLFWRYKAHEQAAVRKGRWKYLKLKEKEGLFDVVADPRERANLAQREPARFAELKELWAAWNAEMLPYPEESYSHDGKHLFMDRY